MPELQGRFPIRVELADLTKADFVRILKEPKNSLTRQQVALLGTEGIELEFTDDAVEHMAKLAFDLNRKTQNIGARRLYTILERVLEDINFEAPDLDKKQIKITAETVKQRLAELIKDEDLTHFIL
jgi:ATP-dependent HslUV protease ATP-binding subunit HslU